MARFKRKSEALENGGHCVGPGSTSERQLTAWPVPSRLMLNWIVQRRRTRTKYANSESDDEDSSDAELGGPTASVLKHRRTRTEYPYGFIESGDEDTLNAGLDGSVALIAVLPGAKARKNQTRSGITCRDGCGEHPLWTPRNRTPVYLPTARRENELHLSPTIRSVETQCR
ncbi:hypothetical protein B0H13DRAFT_1866269 [Mycena leptocephala]|nr:hypothetical protein B0H13DRAFT_1866269 [Mycena leptocephala]